MSLLGSIDTKEAFQLLWERLRAEKRLMTTDERIEEIERDVLMLQVGQAHITDALAKLVKKLENANGAPA